jgi:Tfp pilus assembly protein PilV
MTRKPRGLSIIEASAAVGVMMLGALGLLALNAQGQRMNGDAQRMTRATAVAQDLLNQIALWPWNDARLANANVGNDADLGDSAFAFESTSAPPADHGEADLTLGGTAWLGIPGTELQGGGYERYWNVAYVDDSNGNGVFDAARVAVVVRWPSTGLPGFRRVVLLGMKNNPAEAR